MKGDTWCIVTGYSRIPLFKLGGGRAVLIDSGIPADREGILALLKRSGLTVAGILTSHSHIDHMGNHRVLQREHGAKLYMTPFDAAVTADPMAIKICFYEASYNDVLQYAAPMFCRADFVIGPEDKSVEVEGARFGILRLPGHASDHIGFVTPDSVAYLADALLSDQVLNAVRIPYCLCCELDLQTKRRISGMKYDSFIIAHNGVYAESKGIADRNISKLHEKVETVYDLINRPMAMEDIVLRASEAMGVRRNTLYKIRVSECNIRTYVEYLTETGRLLQRAKDGMIEYIRTDWA